MPKISPMAMRLIARLTRSDVDLGEVREIIEKDVVLCGQLLKTVNSARYARRTEINQVRDAVVLLGTGRLRRLALSLTVSNLFGRVKTAPGWSTLRFNFHSAAVAVMAELLAEAVPVSHGDGALVSALLHDVGKHAIAVNLQPEYELIAAMWTSSGKPIDECEREILGFDHAELGGLMLARWEIAAPLQQAVFYHHRPDQAPDGGGGQISLSRLLHVADRFVRYLGISVEETAPERMPAYSLDVPGLRLTEPEILARFEVAYKDLAEAFR